MLTLVLPLTPAADVPLDVQLPAYLKALGFDRNLEVDNELVVGVIFDPADPESTESKDRILQTHRELTRTRVKGRRARLVPLAYREDSPVDLEEADVLLVTRLSDEAVIRIAEESRTRGLLTFATSADDVERGLAVGMEVANGRPGFVVNLEAAAEAGAAFEASFLALCRIVERKP